MAVPTLRSAEEPAKPVHPRTLGCRFTVPVRSFRGAQSRRQRTARRCGVYRLRPEALSTKNAHFSWPAEVLNLAPEGRRGRKVKWCLNLCGAALRPYSCVVLRVVSRDGIATGAFSPRQLGQFKGFGCRRWRPRSHPASCRRLIHRPADSVWGKFGCGKPPSIRGAGDGELGPNTVARRNSIKTGRRHRARQ